MKCGPRFEPLLRVVLATALLWLLLGPGTAMAAPGGSTLELKVTDPATDGFGSSAVRIIVMLTLIAVAPMLLLLMTSFVRLIITFHFLRQALGTPQMPPNQVLIALSLFLTLFVMSPVVDEIHQQAWQPYTEGEIDTLEAVQTAAGPVKEFMLHNTRQKDLKLFLQMGRFERPEKPEDLPMRVVVPAFAISEMRTGFEIGFLLFLPFLVVDLVVASVLLSMGMMMLPPAMVSLPFKIMLFVLVDGWTLVVGSLVAGFR
ncbi:MAG: flagellar type III secretion system pore protein FliP [Acidobacteriota bacterium]|nr:flagellar type III secretion system pore protein FliP [Acidobacteriota bacterium]MDQ7088958.1 flagellar type III secretion system pore protein FliP [Acidobacteriota bacterium]